MQPQPVTEEDHRIRAAWKRTVALMRKNPPNTEWILKWVACWMPDDPIFHKSYKYVRPKPETVEEDEYFSNDDGFYSDLPVLDDKVIKKTNRMRQSKEQSIKKKIAACKARQERDRQREADLLAKQEELEDEASSSDDLDFFDGMSEPVPNQVEFDDMNVEVDDVEDEDFNPGQ